MTVWSIRIHGVKETETLRHFLSVFKKVKNICCQYNPFKRIPFRIQHQGKSIRMYMWKKQKLQLEKSFQMFNWQNPLIWQKSNVNQMCNFCLIRISIFNVFFKTCSQVQASIPTHRCKESCNTYLSINSWVIKYNVVRTDYSCSQQHTINKHQVMGNIQVCPLVHIINDKQQAVQCQCVPNNQSSKNQTTQNLRIKIKWSSTTRHKAVIEWAKCQRIIWNVKLKKF